MIDIAAVVPTPQEMRAIRRGWGVIHWICMIPTYAFLAGFIAFGTVASFIVGDALPDGLFSVFLVASWLVSALGSLWYRSVVAKAQKSSPTGDLPWRWTVDESGFVFDNGLQRNQLHWRGIKSVTEERDRFIFLVTPMNNPVLPKRLLTEAETTELRALIDAARTEPPGVDSPPLPSDNHHS